MKILAFAGYTGAGKSTAAELVGIAFPTLFFEPPHIKMPMVEMAIPFLRRLGVPDDMMMYYLDDPVGKLTPIPGYPNITGKLVLQVIGKPFRDGVDPTGNIFIVMYRDTALALAEEQKRHVLMASLRFPNEHRVLGDEATTIWIDRPGHKPLGDEFEPRLDTKYTVSNSGSEDFLFSQILPIIKTEGFLDGTL